ncbi:hypothetical protein ACLK17_22210 [Escherichia coli]
MAQSPGTYRASPTTKLSRVYLRNTRDDLADAPSTRLSRQPADRTEQLRTSLSTLHLVSLAYPTGITSALNPLELPSAARHAQPDLSTLTRSCRSIWRTHPTW